jgi:N-alpha-acetyl-L-2,4-diaminobutyrate deacetylase
VPDGSPTQQIADYFLHTLLPMADFVLGFGSGGKTLDFAARVLADKAQQAAFIAAMRAFNAPYSMTLQEIDAVGIYDTAAEHAGKVFVSTGMGGGGAANARSARRRVENVLKHAKILSGASRVHPSVEIDTTTVDGFHLVPAVGLLKPLIDLGEVVAAGAPLARIWSVGRTHGAGRQVSLWRAAAAFWRLDFFLTLLWRCSERVLTARPA